MSNSKRVQDTNLMVPGTYSNRLSARIKTSKILTKLQRCALGKEDMTPVQFNAAKLLLNKTLPDAVQPKDDGNNGIKDVTHVPTWRLLEALDGEVVK
jgi:hypothetical protein